MLEGAGRGKLEGRGGGMQGEQDKCWRGQDQGGGGVLEEAGMRKLEGRVKKGVLDDRVNEGSTGGGREGEAVG